MLDGATIKMTETQPLFLGLRGDEVKRVQDRLNRLNKGLKFSAKKKIKESGFFGFDMVQFVKDFQSFFGIPITGFYDKETHGLVEGKFSNLKSKNKKS